METLVRRIFWFLTVILIPALTLMGPGPALGDTTWTYSGEGSWFTDTNWDNGVPNSTTDAYFNNGGTATIDSGDAAAQNIQFGTYDGASGTITQTGGTLTVPDNSPGLMLGAQSGGSGYYNLEGGTLNTQFVVVGNLGDGEFLQKAGTTHNVGISLNLGGPPSGQGEYTLQGGTLTTANELIGGDGTGTFTQTGGTHTVSGTSPGLMLGAQSTGKGYFNLNGGSLDTQVVVVGNNGYGGFLQEAGTTLTVATRLTLGQLAGGEGNYTMEGGSINFGSGAGLQVGTGGTGTFTQNGGSVSWSPSTEIMNGALIVGGNTGTGSYYLQGSTATLTMDGNEIVGGPNGQGYFSQSGGTNTISRTGSDGIGRLAVGYHDGSQGTYELSGGTLIADRVIIGYTPPPPSSPVQAGTGQGTMIISGGSLEAGELLVGGADSGGGFGKLDLANASANVVVSELLQFGGLGQLTAVPGATIHMTGSEFQNTSTNADNLAGLSNLTLSFEGTGSWDHFEVAGTDLGPVMAGFTDNFALGTLKLGTDNWLQLVDDFDNSEGLEALYVYNLILGEGAQLDLNGLHLYYLSLSLSYEDPQQFVPLPAAVWLLATGLLGLLGLRRKLTR